MSKLRVLHNIHVSFLLNQKNNNGKYISLRVFFSSGGGHLDGHMSEGVSGAIMTRGRKSNYRI